MSTCRSSRMSGGAHLLGLLVGAGLTGVESSGDPGALQTLFMLLDEPDPNFAVVTP